MPEPGLLAALLMGLLGSGHCASMCGGIACTLTVGLDPAVRSRPARLAPYLLGYNAGRIASYCVAGGLTGFVGLRVAGLLPIGAAHVIGFTLSGVFLLVVGAYLGGWWAGLVKLEQLGARLWRRLEPLGRGLLPVRSPGRALALGLVWGWLPCGLVYAALVLALTAGGPGAGALHMLAFGLGTAPMLIAAGAAGGWLASLARKPDVRRWAGACVAGLGVLTLLGALAHPRADHPLLANALGLCVADGVGERLEGDGP